MNCPAYPVTIETPKARSPPPKTLIERQYDHACIRFLFACFNEFSKDEIIVRAYCMREAKALLERQ